MQSFDIAVIDLPNTAVCCLMLVYNLSVNTEKKFESKNKLSTLLFHS